MMKLVKVVMCLGLIYGVRAQEQGKKIPLTANLVVTSDIAYGLNTGTVQKSELIIKPEFSYRFNPTSRMVFKGRVYNEFYDNLEEGVPEENTVSPLSKRLFIGDRTHLEWRELYVNSKLFQRVKVTLGKQQIVWGEADGLKVLDILNPQNFREFILDDFEDSRIPLWSLKAEFEIGKIGVQWVWIPDQTYHIIPDFDAPFFIKSIFPNPPENVVTQFGHLEKPKKVFKDSDIGLQLSTFSKGWDVTLNYAYYYEDLPTFYRTLQTSESGTPIVQITPRFTRQHLVGTTFNKAVGAISIRGEIAYIFDQNFLTTRLEINQGIDATPVWNTALGIDYSKGETMLSAQIFSNIIMEDVSPFNRDDSEWNTSALLTQELFNDSLKVETLWVHNLNEEDGMIQPQIEYWMNSSFQLFVGAAIFYGNSQKLFGQFTDQNRISLGCTWGI